MTKVLESKKLWLCGSHKTNDLTEITWIKHIIEKKSSSLDQKYSDFIFSLKNSYNLNQMCVFLACFSENGNLLSQWREYAHDPAEFIPEYSTSTFWIFYLGLCSFSHDGYFHEKAIRMLSETSVMNALPYMILRLTDWVNPISSLATDMIIQKLVPENAEFFLEN